MKGRVTNLSIDSNLEKVDDKNIVENGSYMLALVQRATSIVSLVVRQMLKQRLSARQHKRSSLYFPTLTTTVIAFCW